MAEQDPAVVRGWVWRSPNGALVPRAYPTKENAYESARESEIARGWSIVPVEIRELPAEQAEQEDT